VVTFIRIWIEETALRSIAAEWTEGSRSKKGLWCISDETRMKRLGVLVNSSVFPFDGVKGDGTPNSKRVNTTS
jgi:hypothetical protein